MGSNYGEIYMAYIVTIYDAFDSQVACGLIGFWALAKWSRTCLWACLVQSTVVVASYLPLLLALPSVSSLALPYPWFLLSLLSFTSLDSVLLLLVTLCLAHRLPPWFVVGFLATLCMSEPRRVLVNAEDLENLIQAASQLHSAAVALASSPVPARSHSAPGSFVQIASESEPQGLDNRAFVWEASFNRLVEDGPGEIPEQLLDFGKHHLPCSEYSAAVRVAEAFRAGFWAWAAVATATPYQRLDPPPRVATHWIVLRAGGRAVARFENITSFEHYVRGCTEEDLVYEAFQNIAEVHIFCHAARIFLPRCLVWRSSR